MKSVKTLTVVAAGMVLCIMFGSQTIAQGQVLVIVANQDGYKLAENWIEFLKNESVPYKLTNPAEFETHKKEKFIAILGGPNEPEGVGEIVKQLLTKEEQDWVGKPGNSRIYLKENVWREGQKVLIFAGSDKEMAAKARTGNRSKWIGYLNDWFNIDISTAGLSAY